jgi:NADH dehydrogenase, FAD-containing subunit
MMHMKPIANIPNRDNLKRIVIIGGGFAGLHFVKKSNIYKKSKQLNR